MPRSTKPGRSGHKDSQQSNADEQAFEFEDLSEKGKQPGEARADDIQAAPWKALFFFTSKSHLSCLLVALGTAVVSGIASPAAALVTGKAFDAFTSVTDGNELVKKETEYVLYMLGIGFGSWLLHFVFFAAWIAFGELQANSARNRLFNGMLTKDIEWYDLRKNGVGALIPRLLVQVRELQLATSQPLGSLVTTAATAAFDIGLALFYSWKLTLVIICTVPVIVGVLGSLGATMQPHVKKQQEKLTEALKHVTGALHAIETVKCFNGQDHEIRMYNIAMEESSAWYMRVVRSNALQFAITSFMSSAMFIQGFYYGGMLVDKGEMTSGDVVTTFLAALGAFQSIAGILPQMIVLEKGRTAGATLRAVMTQIEKGPTVSRTRGPLGPDRCKGDIRLKNVSFAYPSRPDYMALRDVTLFIPSGHTTFIIGKSGSGKSTLGQLLMRFYPPALGEIFLDDSPLDNLDTMWLRRQITLVEQHTSLFEDTVFNNIALGKHDHHRITKNEVVHAVEFALLKIMVSDMPNGLDTLVGSRGTTMSGGQRQRMALARAYLRDTPVLMLDESTSALDQVSRSLMIDAIREWRQGKTTIIITHDVSQILVSDYTIIFEHGKLVQEGYRQNLERIKGGAFQGFMTDDQQAQLSPFDVRRHTSAELKERALAAELPASPLDNRTFVDDPLEIHFRASEKTRSSFLPTAFTNKHTSAVIQGAGRFGKPNAGFMPLFLDSTNSLAISPTSSTSSRRSWSDGKEQRGQHNEGKGFTQHPVAPGVWETYLNKTGNLAARARLPTSNRKRQRLHSEASANATPTKRQQKRKRLPHLRSRPTDPEARQVDTVTSILRTIWPSLDWSSRVVLIIGFMSTATGAAGSPVFSYILAQLFETYGTGAQGKHKALVYSLSIIGIAFVMAASAFFQHYCLEYAGQRWINRIRELALERILNQPRDFHTNDENSVSRITESLDRHAEEMRNLLGRFSSIVLTAFIMIVVSITWALITQWKITLVALAVGPYVWFVTKAFSTVSGKWEARSNNSSEISSAIFFETFTTIKTVRALVLEKHFSEKHVTATTNTLVIGLKRALWSGFFYGLADVSGDFVMALLFYSGAVFIRDGASAAKIVQVFVQLIITITNVSTLLNFIPQMSAARDMASRILRLSRLPNDSHENMGTTRIATIGDIVFTNLTFSYPSRPDQVILNNVSMTIPANKCTAIVGSSGSGKSTVASLLLSLYTTNNASPVLDSVPDLMVAGRNIKHIHTPTLRSLITIVSQSPTLFSATIAENIAYGLPADSRYRDSASVRHAAAAAGIDDFVMSLPLGYATRVGEGGMGLSGGQAQRLAIARALVRRPAVLILDEATSALDVENAGLIRQTVGSLVRGGDMASMAVIIITHSQEMMSIAEKIIVLDQGEVVEQGGYDELLSRPGPFHHLVSGGEWAPSPAVRKQSVTVEGMTGTVDWGGSKKVRTKAG